MSGSFLRFAPDSIAFQKNRDGRAHLAIGANLVWSLWFFGDLMYGQRADVPWVTSAAIGFPAIIVLWWLAMTRSRRHVVYYCGAMAVLGYAILRWNHSGGTACVIYACSALGFAGSVRRSLGWMVFFSAIYVGETLYFQWPWGVVIGMVFMALTIGAANLLRRTNEAKDEQIRLSHDEVRRLAATAERERIGRDLHDLLGHTLSLIALKSELAGKLIARDPVAARREMADVERITRDSLVQVRSAVSGMRAAGLVGELASARLLLECAGVRFSYSGFDGDMPPEQETCLALALREAATNIQRHARATSAHAELGVEGGAVWLRVGDDGDGGIHSHGNGLTGMRERVEALGGTLTIAAVRGSGTTLDVRLPVAASNVIGLADAAASARRARA